MSALIVVNFKTYASAQGGTASLSPKPWLKSMQRQMRDGRRVSAFDTSAVKAAAPSLQFGPNIWIQSVGVLTQAGCIQRQRWAMVLQAR